MFNEPGLLWLVGALAGSMLFFGVVVAPQVFRSLPAEQAGIFLRAFFPNYYLWGLLLAVVAALVALPQSAIAGLLCALIAVLFLFARQYLMPRINAARDASVDGDAAASQRFSRLHLFSVVINALQLLALLVIAAWLVFW